MSKFLVRTGFGGTVELEIEAENEEAAFDKANDAIGDMEAIEFLSKLEPQRSYQDAELMEETTTAQSNGQ